MSVKTLNRIYDTIELEVTNFPTETCAETNESSIRLFDGAKVDLLAEDLKSVLPAGKVIVDFPVIDKKYDYNDVAKLVN